LPDIDIDKPSLSCSFVLECFQQIADTIGCEMNGLYELFCQRNASFCGAVSVAGHSLGMFLVKYCSDTNYVFVVKSQFQWLVTVQV